MNDCIFCKILDSVGQIPKIMIIIGLFQVESIILDHKNQDMRKNGSQKVHKSMNRNGKEKQFSASSKVIKQMIFNSPLRKNYLLNSDYSVITERREESDQNSRSLSKSCDSINKKSPSNSLQKIKQQQIRRKQQIISRIPQRPHIINRNNNINIIKQRSHSINTFYNNSNLKKNENKPDPHVKNKINQSFGYDSIVIKRHANNSPNGLSQKNKTPKFQKQASQISTEEPPSLINNFIIENDRPVFVRFSESIINTKEASGSKPKNKKKGSLSILKNRNNAISCNKIDGSYLKFRDKIVNQKQRPFDAVKNKYNQVLQGLKDKFIQRMGKQPYSYFDLLQEEKYKEDLFPATVHSLFYSKGKSDEIKTSYAKNQMFEFVEISWRRISDIFPPTSRLILFKQSSVQKVIRSDFSIASSDFLLSLNAIKNVFQFFNKVFETKGEKYEKHGIYCLKIFQENTWKSIIIDDQVPVIILKNRSNGQTTAKSLFVDVQIPANRQQIEVWPFLLEKAYASYYNSYESLHQNFKIIDWMQEILMAPSECIFFPDNQQLSEEYVKKLQKNITEFPTSESIIIGINMKTKQPCIIEKRQSQTNQQVMIKTIKSERKMKIKHLLEIIHTFYLFMPFHFKYFNTCYINFNKGKKPLKQHPMTRINYRDQILIRTFNVDQEGPFSITVRQKQKRFYQRNLKKYQYVWNRCILVQKQFNNGYRWIDGKYSNEKSISFNLYLEKGEFELIMMPEPGSDENLHDLTMIVLSNTQIGIERKLYEQKQNLIETVCCDIAQRKGVFKQLNDFTCSYSFVENSSAMIIENINNQKTNGEVAITRSIAGLKAKFDIYPFNFEFCINEYEANIHKRKYKKTIDLLIGSNSHFTVVLMMRGGIDDKFLKVFKFSN